MGKLIRQPGEMRREGGGEGGCITVVRGLAYHPMKFLLNAKVNLPVKRPLTVVFSAMILLSSCCLSL